MVYVDDFKMSGKPADMKKTFKDLHEVIDMDEEAPVDKCIGVKHIVGTEQLPNGKWVRTMEWDHCDFFAPVWRRTRRLPTSRR